MAEGSVIIFEVCHVFEFASIKLLTVTLPCDITFPKCPIATRVFLKSKEILEPSKIPCSVPCILSRVSVPLYDKASKDI